MVAVVVTQVGGGSSFISGHEGCNAITSSTSRTHTGQPNHYSGKVFSDTMIDPGIHVGNGKGKITYLGSTLKKARQKAYDDSSKLFTYVERNQMIVIPETGYYNIQLWGASGNNSYNTYTSANPSYGGYTAGDILLEEGTLLNFFVGGSKVAYNAAMSTTGLAGSGGATDVRLNGGRWYNTTSLRSRIMVAGGAGGSYSDNSAAGGSSAGGLTNYTVSHGSHPVYTVTQTAGGAAGYSGTAGTFGKGGTNSVGGYTNGAGGYYGGGSGPAGGGGSSFISGHTGCVAVTSKLSTTARTGTGGASCTTGTTDNLCSIHYSGLKFVNTLMIDGKGYSWKNTKIGLSSMPNPTSDESYNNRGHSGNGYAKIKYIGKRLPID